MGLIDWHPTAENILVSAGYDYLVIIWDTARGLALNVIQCHSDTIFSMSFNRSGKPYNFLRYLMMEITEMAPC